MPPPAEKARAVERELAGARGRRLTRTGNPVAQFVVAVAHRAGGAARATIGGVSSRAQRSKTAKRRPGGSVKDAERRRIAGASRARRGEQPRRPVAWCDGGVRGEHAAAAFVLRSATGRVIAEEVHRVPAGPVEEVECAAVAAALERAAELRLDGLEVRLDSQVVVGWLTGGGRRSAPSRSLRRVSAQLPKLGHVSFRWVPRELNARADELVWAALCR